MIDRPVLVQVLQKCNPFALPSQLEPPIVAVPAGDGGLQTTSSPAMDDHDQEQQNPIVAMAMRLRARRDLGAAIDSATDRPAEAAGAGDAQAAFGALADTLAVGSRRLNTILGKDGVTFVRLAKPPRLRLRFRGRRIALDLDAARELVRVSGLGLDGDYQFDPGAAAPALINLSQLSTEPGYGGGLTGSALLKLIAADAELPRPPHLDAPGPMRF